MTRANAPFAALILLAFAGAAQAAPPAGAPAGPPVTLTAAEIQSLPLRDLARRLLGAVGDLVVDVERPSWGSPLTQPPGAPAADWPPAGPAPPDSITFYGQPRFVGTFQGLCGADTIEVVFEGGRDATTEPQQVASIHAETRYGLEGPRTGEGSIEAEAATCARASTSRGYFPAPDAGAADEIAWLLSVVKDAATASPDMPFPVTCGPEVLGVCADRRTFLKLLDLRDIETAAAISCPPNAAKFTSCYELTMREPSRRLIRMARLTWRMVIAGTDYMNKPKVFSVTLTPEIAIS